MIKKLLLTSFFAAAFALTSNGQTLKGTKMIGGAGSADFDNGFGLYLQPNLGFFVIDDLALGSGIPLGYSNRNANDYRYIGVGLQPFVRYYFGQDVPTRVFLQANGEIHYGSDKSVYDGREQKTSYKQHTLGGRLGIAHFLTEQVGLEAQLHFNHNLANSNPTRSRFYLSFGIQVHLPSSNVE